MIVEPSEWIEAGNLLVGVIGIVLSIIGGKELHESNKLKIQFRDLNEKIDKIEVNNSQVAQTINNNGLGLRDTEEVATRIVDEKTKNKPDVVVSKEEPQGLKDGDIWIQPMD